MEFDFEKTGVYYKSLTFAKGIHYLTISLADEHSVFSGKIRACSASLPLHIAKATAESDRHKKMASLASARVVCFACIPALELLREVDAVSSLDYHRFRAEAEVIAEMLNLCIMDISEKAY